MNAETMANSTMIIKDIFFTWQSILPSSLILPSFLVVIFLSLSFITLVRFSSFMNIKGTHARQSER